MGIEKTKWRARTTFFWPRKSANQKYGKEVQHLSTKSEETAIRTNESKQCTSLSISNGWIRFT